MTTVLYLVTVCLLLEKHCAVDMKCQLKLLVQNAGAANIMTVFRIYMSWSGHELPGTLMNKVK